MMCKILLNPQFNIINRESTIFMLNLQFISLRDDHASMFALSKKNVIKCVGHMNFIEYEKDFQIRGLTEVLPTNVFC